jgi:hypothetical protein
VSTTVEPRTGRSVLLLALFFALFTTGVVTVGAKPANAIDNFSNAAIADQALARVGQSGGQCKQFANDMARIASGGSVTLGGGYYSDYQREGGQLQSSTSATKGDIIQLNGPNVDLYYTGMHTAIVVANLSGGSFDVVDSNSGSPLNNEIVHHHTWNPYSAASTRGLNVSIWRLGVVTVAQPPPPTDPNNPKGNYEGLTQVLGGVRLTGWTLDPNTSDPIAVHVYEGSCCANPRGAFTANNPRPDVGAAFSGSGDNHGFNIFLSLPNGVSGSKTYCAYAINVGAGNSSPELGCRTVTFNWNPVGNYEEIRRAPGGVHLTGWTLDYDAADPIALHVYEGQCCANPRGAFTANISRPDVAAAFPGHGENHGFEVSIGSYPTTPVSKTYCGYAINGGYGNSSPELGCRTLTVSPNVEGNYEGIEAVSGGARITGWTVDPDVSDTTEVHVYEGNCCSTLRAFLTANISRFDVGSTWPDYGNTHGFDAVVSLPPGYHTLCAFGINVAGTAGTNKELGCRSVIVN